MQLRPKTTPPHRRPPAISTDDLPADPEWQLTEEDTFWDPFDPLGDWWDEQERPE